MKQVYQKLFQHLGRSHASYLRCFLFSTASEQKSLKTHRLDVDFSGTKPAAILPKFYEQIL